MHIKLTRQSVLSDLAFNLTQSAHYTVERQVREVPAYTMCIGYEPGIRGLYSKESFYNTYESMHSDKLRYIQELVIAKTVSLMGERAFSSLMIHSVDILGSISTWGSGVFADCRQLVKASIGEGTKSIGRHMFSGCLALKEITLPHSLEVIDVCAFRSCKNLRHVMLPGGLKEIKAFAFASTGLESIVIPPGTQVKRTAFLGCNIKRLTVPKGFSIDLEGLASDVEVEYYGLSIAARPCR